MRVLRHTEVTLVALTADMPMPASVILNRLRQMDAPDGTAALEVCRMTIPKGAASSSNGDSVVVIVRDGAAITAMLRRSEEMLLPQPFTPGALRVDQVASWQWHTGRREWTA